MKIFFLGDVVGVSGRSMLMNNLLSKVKVTLVPFCSICFRVAMVSIIPLNIYTFKFRHCPILDKSFSMRKTLELTMPFTTIFLITEDSCYFECFKLCLKYIEK